MSRTHVSVGMELGGIEGGKTVSGGLGAGDGVVLSGGDGLLFEEDLFKVTVMMAATIPPTETNPTPINIKVRLDHAGLASAIR